MKTIYYLRPIKAIQFLTTIILFTLSFGVLTTGCNKSGNSLQTDYDNLNSRYDSLQRVHDNTCEFLTAISEGVDSVLIQEGYILNYTNGERPLTAREQLLQNIDTYEQILARQKNKLSELEKKLEKMEDGGKLKTIIAGLRAQIEQKDSQIAELRSELNDKNANIASLTQRVSSLSKDVETLNEVNASQEKVLAIQDDMLNTAYVKIATKKELEQDGLLSKGGFMKKKKFDISNIEAAQFSQIDIRNTTTFNIPGKNPKVLTQMPKDSYSISKNGNGTCTLTIVDPTAFWSVSNYLVIQY